MLRAPLAKQELRASGVSCHGLLRRALYRATASRGAVGPMTHVTDEGIFDEPIDKIWRYLQDQSEGVHVHSSIRGSKPLEQKGSSVTLEMEMANPDGKTTRKETWRFVYNPPHGFEMESLAGISKGTKYAHRYTPMGNRTRVEVEGEFRMQGLDEATTRHAALGMLAQVFEEDQANLRRYK